MAQKWDDARWNDTESDRNVTADGTMCSVTGFQLSNALSESTGKMNLGLFETHQCPLWQKIPLVSAPGTELSAPLYMYNAWQ